MMKSSEMLAAEILAKPQESTNEKIESIELSRLKPFAEHPFKVEENEDMANLIESIREQGVLTPLLVRPDGNGDYEIISGHRRVFACKALEMEAVPCIIKELSRAEAVVAMVDSNLQRERILPSEKAFAYKIKLEALKHQGKSSSRQVVGKSSETADIISDEESGRQVQRYIRLTHLIPELLQYVDDGRIALTPAVALSYLNEQQQFDLLSAMEYCDCTPSLSQAVEMKKQSFLGILTKDKMYDLLSQEKPNQKERIKIPMEKIEKYFPRSYSAAQIEAEIVKLCEAHHKKQEKKRGEAR